MADVKITALPAITSFTGVGLVPVVNDSAGTAATSKITFANLEANITNVTGGLATGLAKITTTTGALSTVTAPAGTIVGTSDAQILTNKTIDAASNTLSNISNTEVKAAAAIAVNKLAALTASRAVVSDGSGFITQATTTSTEIGFVSGVTSAIQTQVDGKQGLDSTLTALAAYNTNGLLTQTAADTFTGRTITGTANQIAVSNGDGVAGAPTLSLTGNAKIRTFGVSLDGAGSALSTGQKGYVTIPFSGTITAWNITADAGTCTFDIWKIGTGTAIPTVANTIMGTKPALASGTAIHSTTLTAWTTSITANDIIGFNLDAIATATKITLVVEVTVT